MKLKSMMLAAAVVSALGAMAMPTRKELEKAQPLVNELLQDDRAAQKSGKKTPVEVGDASMKFASEAKGEAEKLLLYKGAVYCYVRCGNGEKAAEAVEALRAEIAEVPPEVVVEIIFTPADKNKKTLAKLGPRLMAIYKVVRVQAAARKAIPAVKRELAKNPADKKNLRKLAELLAMAGDWTAARENFAKGGGKAAQAVKDEADGKVQAAGDFWWTYESAEKDEGEVFKRHAVALYQTGLDRGVFDGLNKRVVEKRVKQYGDVEIADVGKGATVAKGRKAGETKTITLPGGEKLELVWCPPCPQGFMMGSPKEEKDHQTDETQHKVILSKGFWIGKCEVTQAQWESVMKTNASTVKGKDLPVQVVSWEDCCSFCEKAGQHLRLPTEAEWEYACRAGNVGVNEEKLEDVAWIKRNSKAPQSVGTKKANLWGIHDMFGNVWEWCQDRYGDYPEGEVTDPKGPDSGTERVMRGGSFWNDWLRCRSAGRYHSKQDIRSRLTGFRVAMSEESAK